MKKKLLSIILLLLAGFSAAQAYDFSAVTPSGQTLFYTIDTVTNTTVSVVGFDNTQPLGNLTIPDTVTYGGNTYSVTSIGIMAFLGCKGLTSVAIPNSVTSIGRAAFQECEDLTSVTMPNSITSIELSTFAGCSSLTSVTIPNSVTSIERGAFSFCTSLTSLTIPSSVTSIGDRAFYLVKHIEYHGTATGGPWGAISMNDYQDNDFIYSDSTETTLLAYIGHDTVVTVANTVDTIGPGAFYSCSWLTSVSLPNSVTSIGASAFSECKNLTSMTIPNSVTSIGASAFCECKNLISMTIPNSVTTIEPALFYGCEGLTSVTIPNSVTKICGGAFTRCTGIASLTIPNSVDTIELLAFGGDITATNGVRHVTYYGSALDTTGYDEGTPILETWGAQSINGYIENGIVYTDSTKTAIQVYIGDAYRIGADSVTIPNTVTDIYSPGFSDCRGPLSVNLPNSLTWIAFYAFARCTGLTSIIIPDSVTFIGMGAFAGCTNLQEVKLPNAPAWIVSHAFRGCTSLTSLTIPNLIREIGSGAFSACTGLTSLYYEADSCLLSSAFYYDTNITQLVIGENVRWIPADAFSHFGMRILYQDGVPTGYEPIIISPTIISKSRVAPALGTDVFAGIADTVPVYIPCGSGESYDSSWSYFSNFIEVVMDTLTVETENSEMGVVEVLEEPSCANGSTATIAAYANPGYYFTAWSDGNTDNPRYIVVTQDTIITAHFEEIVGIDTPLLHPAHYSQEGNRIVVNGAEGQSVRVFDIMGKLISSQPNVPEPFSIYLPAAGVYLIQIGSSTPQKIVVH